MFPVHGVRTSFRKYAGEVGLYLCGSVRGAERALCKYCGDVTVADRVALVASWKNRTAHAVNHENPVRTERLPMPEESEEAVPSRGVFPSGWPIRHNVLLAIRFFIYFTGEAEKLTKKVETRCMQTGVEVCTDLRTIFADPTNHSTPFNRGGGRRHRR